MLPEDTMHVRLPNPGDPYTGMGKGLSPMMPLARSGDVDNVLTAFLKLQMDAGAMPRYLLSVDAPLNQQIIDEATEAWLDRYGGSDNWIKPLIQGHGATAQRLSATFSELDMARIDARNESRMMMPFGVPRTLIESRPALAQATYPTSSRTTRCPETTLSRSWICSPGWRYPPSMMGTIRAVILTFRYIDKDARWAIRPRFRSAR